jgi:hypothetical protein
VQANVAGTVKSGWRNDKKATSIARDPGIINKGFIKVNSVE